MKNSLLIVISITFLGACKEEVKDINYWDTHEKERNAKIVECNNNPAKAREDGNCINIATWAVYKQIEADQKANAERAAYIEETIRQRNAK